MSTSRSAQYNALVDQLMRACEEQNMNVAQLTVVFDKVRPDADGSANRTLARNTFLTWRAGTAPNRVFDDTGVVVSKALAIVKQGKIEAQEGNRPSQLIRRKGPALFTNGKHLYKAGRLTGKGPRSLYRVDPDSEKAVDFCEQLKTVIADGAKEKPPRPPKEASPHGPVKRARVAVPLANEREIERDARWAELFGPLPPGIDDLLALRERTAKAHAQLEHRLANIEQMLGDHLVRIQDVLTRPAGGSPNGPSKRDEPVNLATFVDRSDDDFVEAS